MDARLVSSVLVGILLSGASSATGAVTFSGPTYYDPGGLFSTAAISGDFNGDGIPDLVSLTRDNSYSPYDTHHQFFYFQGVGDGTFETPIPTTFGSLTTDLPKSVVAADMDNDGNLDVIIGFDFDATSYSYSTTITVHLGDGTGHFASDIALTSGQDPQTVAAADFNGDGNVDIAAVGAYGVWIHLGHGDGTFEAPTQVDGAPGGGYTSMAVADFNADGRLDIVVASETSTFVLRNTTGGHFEVLPVSPSVWSYPQVAVGDVNGDGKLDLAVSSWQSGLGGTFYGGVSIFIGNGDGSFTAGQGVGGGQGVVLADFNTDGNLDLATEGLIAPGIAGIIVVLGDGTGAFGSPSFVAATNSYMFVEDFDQDGRPDIGELSGGIGILINQSSRGCVDKLQLDYTNGTLNVTFTLKSTAPMTWGTWLAFQTSIIPLWSVPIPPVPNLVTFTLPFAGFPAIGPIAVLTAMGTATSGLTCGDWKIVDTGGPGPTASALAQSATSRLRLK
jgi:FG-GAP-like repeat/FG-GAP repeat